MTHTNQAEKRINGKCDPEFSRVQETFENLFEEGRELGAGVALCIDGKLVVDLWGGFVDTDRTRRWEKDTLVNVYSTTKGMAAACVHRLIDQGLLDPDRKVLQYWPEFGCSDKERIRLRHLLSHQAGLPVIDVPLPPEAIFDWSTMTDALACKGAIDGYRVLSPESVERARNEQSRGSDQVLIVETRFGLGFMMPVAGAEMDPNDKAFGHPGLGGSLGFADPEAGVGFGYVMNLTGSSILIDDRATALISAMYDCLD